MSEWASPERLAAAFRTVADSPLSFPLVVGIFVAAGFIAFPVTLLIAATAITFGTWEGLSIALTGSMSSALATYAAGRWLGADLLRRVMGPRINRVARKVKSNGILAVTTMRVMPTAPFMLVNMVAGATKIRLLDYTIGTFLNAGTGHRDHVGAGRPAAGDDDAAFTAGYCADRRLPAALGRALLHHAAGRRASARQVRCDRIPADLIPSAS